MQILVRNISFFHSVFENTDFFFICSNCFCVSMNIRKKKKKKINHTEALGFTRNSIDSKCIKCIARWYQSIVADEVFHRPVQRIDCEQRKKKKFIHRMVKTIKNEKQKAIDEFNKSSHGWTWHTVQNIAHGTWEHLWLNGVKINFKRLWPTEEARTRDEREKLTPIESADKNVSMTLFYTLDCCQSLQMHLPSDRMRFFFFSFVHLV